MLTTWLAAFPLLVAVQVLLVVTLADRLTGSDTPAARARPVTKPADRYAPAS